MTVSDRAEPNLVPLLDVILQLVMFFMLCANFVMEQVNEAIKLPDAIAAKPLDKRAGDYLILHDAGAYGAAMSSNYNTRKLAAEVLISGGTGAPAAEVIRERQTFEHILHFERVPESLR